MDSDFVTSLLATWHSLIDVHVPELPCPAGAGQSPDSFFTPYWDKSSETSGGLVFDSTLCSLASSPFSLPNASNDGSLIRELIGKMGGSGELSPQNYNPGLFHSEDSPKWGHYSPPVNPGFTDLSPAAKFPSLGARSLRGCVGQFTELAEMGKMMSRVSSSPALRPLGSPIGAPQGSKNQNPASQDRAELSNSREESSVSNPDKNPGLEAGAKPPGETNWRKRKAAPRGKEADAEDDSGMKRVKQSDGDNGNEDGSAKTEEEAGGGSDENAGGQDEKLQVKTEAKPPEPPKDYIHVRARRGQATDSHSLAERLRREKISERMKILQDLVPGCSKVTGKALMLDEIINYVQSLQRQVEFLSMKLASVNSSMDTNTNTTTVVKDKNPAANVSSGAMPQYSVGPLINSQFLTVNQYQSFHGDDLQKIVQMGYGQN